jgi:hypothetical protein
MGASESKWANRSCESESGQSQLQQSSKATIRRTELKGKCNRTPQTNDRWGMKNCKPHLGRLNSKNDSSNSNRSGHLRRQPTEEELKSKRRGMSDRESKMANRIRGGKP